MRKSLLFRSAATLLFVAVGGIGCIQLPVEIPDIEGSLDPAIIGTVTGEDFDDTEIRFPTADIDIEAFIEEALDAAGGIASAVSLNAVLLDEFLFEANEGSSFDFLTDIEIVFVPEGEPDSEAITIVAASDPDGLPDPFTLEVQGMVDLLSFANGANEGEIVVRLGGVTPAEVQTWLMTIRLVLVLGIGS